MNYIISERILKYLSHIDLSTVEKAIATTFEVLTLKADDTEGSFVYRYLCSMLGYPHFRAK
jgi:hypothetical protein